MKILINNYGVDFAIENEKTLKDVSDSIQAWTRERDLIFTNLNIDGEQYTIDRLPDRSIDGISEINCEVHSKSDLIISTINEAAAYCDKILGYIAGAEESGKADLSRKNPWPRG